MFLDSSGATARGAVPASSPEAAFKTWLVEDALPLWASAGFSERDGGFYEALDLTGAPLAAAPRRVRVQFRQMAVYARAALDGLSEVGLDRARAAFDYVARFAWSPDGSPGWAALLDADGGCLDPTRDAYDHAFALYGLCWYFRASGDRRALAAIEATLDFVERHLELADGGWRESAGRDGGRRRQNPHMHAFEAYLALYETLGERRFLRKADAMLALFERRFRQPETGTLYEYFDWGLRPVRPASRQRVEPGHMAEWAWLLSEHQRLTGADRGDAARRLLAQAVRCGMTNGEPFLVDALDASGTLAKDSRRLWPQTELIRALRTVGDGAGLSALRPGRECPIAAVMRRYLRPAVRGGWIDAFDLAGRRLSEAMPASSLYHLYGAVAAC